MARIASLVILGLLLCTSWPTVQAATPGSDWPSLNYDAARSNNNALEKTLSAKNFLKLKVHWAVAEPDISYPVVASARAYLPRLQSGKVHVRVVDVSAGKVVTTFTKDASGGLLFENGNLYLAGPRFQELDPASGSVVAQIVATPKVKGGVFVNPLSDGKLLFAGYASGKPNATATLYAFDPQTNQVAWHLPSVSAQGSVGFGRVLTQNASGTDFVDETSGKRVGRETHIFSNWFIGSTYAYTVASVNRGKTAVYAAGKSGHTAWKRVIGPPFIAQDWPHALSADTVYVQSMRPKDGIVALNAQTGAIRWSRQIPNVQSLALANGVLYVLSFGLGEQIRLLGFKAKGGSPLGAITLSTGYFAFSSPGNGLMVANGMVFIRAIGPKGPLLIALGL
jgi:outer membrane protein assembly factor BamB